MLAAVAMVLVVVLIVPYTLQKSPVTSAQVLSTTQSQRQRQHQLDIGEGEAASPQDALITNNNNAHQKTGQPPPKQRQSTLARMLMEIVPRRFSSGWKSNRSIDSVAAVELGLLDDRLYVFRSPSAVLDFAFTVFGVCSLSTVRTTIRRDCFA
jgi:hypothetical protein